MVSSTADVVLDAVDENTSLTSFAAPRCDEKTGFQAAVKERMMSNRERKQAAYEAALAEGDDAKASWNRSKLMVIGEGKAGKTATVRSLLNKTFDKEWKSTIGVELSKSTTGKINAWTPDSQDEEFTVSLLSTLAIHHFKASSAAEKKGTAKAKAGALKQTSTTKKVGGEGDYGEKSRSGSTSRVTSESGGGKAVGRGKRVSRNEEEAEHVAFQYKEKLFVDALSNDSGIKMTIWDYGGQAVFYTLHHLFLSRFGVYLLVFDLRKLVEARGRARDDAEALEYLRFWLNSVKLHAPGAPLLLVGTFGDEVDGSTAMREVKKKVAYLLGQRFTQVVGGQNIDTCLHVIDNKSARGMGELRKAIEHAMDEQEYVRLKVPVKWMKALDQMAALKDNWVPLKTVHEIGKR